MCRDVTKAREKVEDFLAQRRMAVAGVSRTGEAIGNLIYRRLKASGHEVFAINPNATIVDAPIDFGHRCMRWVMGLTGQLPR